MKLACLSSLSLFGLAIAAHGSTFTFNDANAYCVSGACTDQSGTSVDFANNLGPGAVYGVTDPTFIDGDGNPYAARVTVIGTGGPDGSNHSSINVTNVNAWIHYRFEFVESFDETTREFGADTTIANVRFVNIEDIDSNGGQNFTDVAAVNLPLIGLGSALVQDGYLSEAVTGIVAPDVGPEFNFVRLDQSDNDTWSDEINVRADADQAAKDSVTASFGDGGDLSGFDFIWGSTGDARRNVRGWDLTIAADPTVGDSPVDVAPVPLPASFLFLLAGVGGLAFVRKNPLA